MSTHIIDDIKAVKIPTELHGVNWQGDLFIICNLGGDNNVIDTRTGKRARHWSAIAIGDETYAIGKICDRAGSFEGALSRFASGKASPESFIRRCRKALKEAPDFRNSDLRLNFRIQFDGKGMENGDKYYFDKLTQAGAVWHDEKWYGEDRKVFYFGPDQLHIWIEGLHGYAWQNVAVSGPGEI